MRRGGIQMTKFAHDLKNTVSRPFCRRLARGALAATLSLAAFGGLAAASAQAQVFIRDSEIESLLNDYAQPIFRAAGLGSGRVSVRIIKNDVFNAFVLDGRNVFIHTGALQQAKTPNEIIGVIAHESGHIAGGHMAQLRDRIARDQTKSLLLKILGIGLMVAGGGNAGGASDAGKGIFVGGDDILMRSLLADRRAQESSADQSALRYLNATKQSGNGLLETFERFARQEFISDTYRDPFVRSHPVATDRLAQLRDLVARSPYHAVKDPPALQFRHDMMRAKIAGYLDAPHTVFNQYPPSNKSVPAMYARAIATFFQSGIGPGLPAVDALIKLKPDYPYFYELKADMLSRSGRPQEAIEPLRRALKLAHDPPLIRVRLAEALQASGNPAFIDETVDLARKSIISDPNPRAFRILAVAYSTKNRLPEAELATAQAYFLEGNVKQAKIFAKRAQRALKSGSPEWLKADDIISYKGQPTL
jgi:predicted Zn-dependent protease